MYVTPIDQKASEVTKLSFSFENESFQREPGALFGEVLELKVHDERINKIEQRIDRLECHGRKYNLLIYGLVVVGDEFF